VITVPSGLPLPFEVTFDDDDLDVAMKVYDVTGVPALVATVPMTHMDGGTYVASFTPDPDKSYVVRKSVYTDGTYTVLEGGYSSGSESFATKDGPAAAVDYDAVAEAVWDEPTSGHTTAGTFGALALDTLEAVGSIPSGSSGEFVGSVVGVVLEEAVQGVVD
jgi:hypothetical protein